MQNNLFINRHIGPDTQQQHEMLEKLGLQNLDDLIKNVIPNSLLSHTGTTGTNELLESTALTQLKSLANKNKIYKNYIGLGFSDTIIPSVIKRNILENPGWYTAYTPYQAEISQGRLEALLNFQQMIMDLTGFNLANASLLDEATAAAESMSMARKLNTKTQNNNFFVDINTLPQTLDVIKTRAKYQNINVIVGDIQLINPDDYFGVFIQNPNMYGDIINYTDTIERLKQVNPHLVVSMACDILSLVIFKSPKSMGVDIAVGSSQRFGVPIGFGGPSAAYMATHDENKRIMPGRIIGVSIDKNGKKALRMSLQTREQHIRREKATSNICTSQVLLANMAGFYAVYHGYNGLNQIARHTHHLAISLAKNLLHAQIKLKNHQQIFDTVSFDVLDVDEIYTKLKNSGYAIGKISNTLFISTSETSTIDEITEIYNIVTGANLTTAEFILNSALEHELKQYSNLYRNDTILNHNVFNNYHSETKMMRYLKTLENKDLSLVHSMIPLGSCTMKLNAASELEGISWPEFANIHPFAPHDAYCGYLELINDLQSKLKAITGFDDISMQPNSGAQGELAGILAIRRYQESINEQQRNICLIPKSAHGTNPATAQMMGLNVVMVNCDDNGNIDVKDLQLKAQQYKDTLSCLMVTYPSTHGVFEAQIKQICKIIHDNGGQVYMDGANLNALVGLVKPAELGADVSHINLHKTFAIPHGGGGPGMGPIGVKQHLVPFLPKHSIFENKTFDKQTFAVSSAPFGSASILIISWMYISMLGEIGLRESTKVAILNANYIANELKPYYPILYTGKNGKVAHECIIDLRQFKQDTGITEVDFAKRLMDYGFHAPTMSFPVAGTFMIEPTESEDKVEIDRFINAMISIYHEVNSVKDGSLDRQNNPLKNAPHTMFDILNWDKPYSIELGCFPTIEVKQNKVFPSVNRIDDVYGDRNFLCSCFDFEHNDSDFNLNNTTTSIIKESGKLINAPSFVDNSSLNEVFAK